MTILYSIKDFITSGFTIQWYFLFVLILLVTMTIRGFWRIKLQKNISIKFSFYYAVTTLFFFVIILGIYIPQPNLLSPSLPLFDSLEINVNNPLVITFDRPINTNIRFSLYPEVAGSWKLFNHFPGIIPNNSAIFTPSDTLNQGTEYTVTIDNISLLGNNLNTGNSLLFVFTTKNTLQNSESSDKSGDDSQSRAIFEKEIVEAAENTIDITPTVQTYPNEFHLNVPLIKQTYSFSCFSAAGKMALAYYDINDIDEIEFLDNIGYDTTARNFVTNTWGDPNQLVVGSIDGSGSGGYGVHWDPVATYLNTFRPTEVKQKWNIPELLKEVYDGNPVLVWWVNGVWPAKDVSWNLPNGQKVYTVNGMHVEVVTGWKGSIKNPEEIYTNDPWRGKRTYTKGQFTSLWRWFDNTAVVVR